MRDRRAGGRLNTLADRAAQALDRHGPLAALDAHWRERPGQIALARAVAGTLDQGGVLVAQAGTGVGKTLGYLVPLLLSGRRAIVSTATHDLQDQLVRRDIPALSQALGLPVRAVALKGRAAYVCLHRAAQALDEGPRAGDALSPGWLRDLLRWAETSHDGDLAGFAARDAHPALWARVTSTRENCLGAACPRLADCPVERARRHAAAAEWVVVNHAVFMADLALQSADAPGLLPQVDAVIFDEAHGLDALGVAQLSHTLDAGTLHALARDIATEGALRARGAQPWSLLALDIDRATAGLTALGRQRGGHEGRQPWPLAGEAAGAAGHAAHRALHLALHQAHGALQHGARGAPAMAALLHRAARSLHACRVLAPGAPVDAACPARWIEWRAEGGWRLVAAPADSAALWSRVLDPASAGPRRWVFTSATLGDAPGLRWFLGPTGLDQRTDLQVLQVDSPLDPAQAALHVPEDLPEPGDERHAAALADRVLPWVQRLGGRTLVLTTTLRAAQRIALALQAGAPGLQVLVQGNGSRRALLERFRASVRPPATPAVLVATGAFWRGIDLPGEVLQMLVIDKLPFAPPDDPWLQARADRVRAQGGRPFEEVHLADAALALRQGIGRLIRTERDRGLLVIGDRRLLQRHYGAALLARLPPMPRLAGAAEVQAYLDALVLTRPSTTARPSSGSPV